MIKNYTIISLLSLLFVGSSISKSFTSGVKHESMALINAVSFNDSRFNNDNVGNGFILNFEGNNYAITAKHVLLITKPPKMEFLSLAGHLKHWKMYQKNDPSKYLMTDKLLNSNIHERLDWETLSNDWLVFSIKQNLTEFKPLTFRNEALIKGEKLFAIGWTYQDTNGPQRSYEFEFDDTKNGLHTLKQVSGSKNMAGLSGSPIVDKDGLLIGLVSSGWEDEKTKAFYLQASKASDIRLFLENN